MLIKNLDHTSDENPPAGFVSWLDYWEKKSGKRAQHCSHCGCSYLRTRLVGAHVQKLGEVGRVRYIVPLCDACNHKENTLYIPNDVTLVRVN